MTMQHKQHKTPVNTSNDMIKSSEVKKNNLLSISKCFGVIWAIKIDVLFLILVEAMVWIVNDGNKYFPIPFISIEFQFKKYFRKSWLLLLLLLLIVAMVVLS